MSKPLGKLKKMKWPVRPIKTLMAIVAFICFFIFTPLGAFWAWLAPLPDTVQEQVNDAIEHGMDGIIVYVHQSGQAPELYAAGSKNNEHQIPADAQALFKIASISKLYVAAATAKLVNNQTLSLDDTLASYLPEFVGRIENADQITLRMLLQHRSGIPNFVDDEAFNWASQMDNTEYLNLVLDETADFKPDDSQSYSNTNYLLIGNIIDIVLGYSHHEYIKKAILTPLGLNQTYSLLSEVDLEKMASGYHHPYETDMMIYDYVMPGGSMVATAQDVGIFLRALNDGSLLSTEEQAIYASIYEFEHNGWVLGYQSIARYHKDIDTIVVQFLNTTGDDSMMISNIVYNRIVKILQAQ
jgi:D-alanyl-D-alanine carboxypeptidase